MQKNKKFKLSFLVTILILIPHRSQALSAYPIKNVHLANLVQYHQLTLDIAIIDHFTVLDWDSN